MIKKLYNFVDRIGCFMGIFSYESARRIGDQNVLRNLDRKRSPSAHSCRGTREDRAEDENPNEPATVVFSADHDARWIKRGRKSMLG